MRILGICGSKRSGKSSAAKFVMGHVLKQNNVIDKFNMNDNGELLVNAAYRDGTGKIVEDMGVFDIDRIDAEFRYYLDEVIWPHIRIYNFADSLKWICMNIYGIDYEQLYGTSAQKESPTKYRWSSILELIPKGIRPTVDKERFMTAREFVQTIADVLRWVDDECFTKALIQQILVDQCPFSVISDVRRVVEVEGIKAAGGKVIYLTRKLDDGDGHHTEHEFDSVDKSIFDAVIDNRICSIQEKNDLIYKVVHDWGWI